MPLTSGLVVKNGSKIRSRCSGAIPVPVSINSTWTMSPLADDRMVSEPPVLHDVDRVVDEVQEDLLDARHVDLHRREARA